MSAATGVLRMGWSRFWGRPQAAPPSLRTHQLVEIRAALAAGLAPGQALLIAGDGVLAPVARTLRLGGSLYDEGCRVASGDAGADLLVRALGIAERAGAGAGTAVDQALAATRSTREIEQLLAVKTAQARGTARVLTAVPLVIWLFVLVTDPSAWAFYRTAGGLACLGVTLLLLGGGHVWTRRLLQRAGGASCLADPLAPAPVRLDARRAAVAASGPLVVTTLALGVLPGLVIAGLAAVVGGRGRPGRETRTAFDPPA
ncbi:MAG: type II secretion system F family protein, partial [Egibacteraceae bacterium]